MNQDAEAFFAAFMALAVIAVFAAGLLADRHARRECNREARKACREAWEHGFKTGQAAERQHNALLVGDMDAFQNVTQRVNSLN